MPKHQNKNGRFLNEMLQRVRLNLLGRFVNFH